jgi:hypothetical protein
METNTEMLNREGSAPSGQDSKDKKTEGHEHKSISKNLPQKKPANHSMKSHEDIYC